MLAWPVPQQRIVEGVDEGILLAQHRLRQRVRFLERDAVDHDLRAFAGNQLARAQAGVSGTTTVTGTPSRRPAWAAATPAFPPDDDTKRRAPRKA